MTSSPDDQSSTPQTTPSSWHFPKLLRRVRSLRGLTIDEASAGLPGISSSRYQAWEQGLKTPSSWLQTLVVWRLNTVSKQILTKVPSEHRHQGFITVGVPAGVFLVTALLVTLLWMRTEQQSWQADPMTIAVKISESASARGITSAPEDYLDYATELSETIGQFSRWEWDHIVGVEHEG